MSQRKVTVTALARGGYIVSMQSEEYEPSRAVFAGSLDESLAFARSELEPCLAEGAGQIDEAVARQLAQAARFDIGLK